MIIDDVLREPDRIRANYAKLMNGLTLPNNTLQEVLLTIGSTHTFGYEKITQTPDGYTDRAYPYRSILFDNLAFLSDRARQNMTSTTPDPKTRIMTKARSYGLDDYIFTYLGQHEYYYAETKGMNNPAFGVFLTNFLDFGVNANATLYDLESDFAAPYRPEDITLYPHEARQLTATEISQKWDDDFYNYWICNDYVNKAGYDRYAWMQKRELHYHRRVDIHEIAALLWPIRLVFDPVRGVNLPDADLRMQMNEFTRDYIDKIPVYTYIFDPDQGRERFLFASHLITRHYVLHQAYPLPTDFYDQFVERFPN